MNLRTAIFLSVAISAAGLWIWRQSQLQHMRAEIRDLGMRHSSLAMALRSVDAAATSIDTNELTRLRGLRLELAKLRGSLPQLRQVAKQTPTQLEAEAAALEKEAALVRAELAADDHSKQVAQSISLAQDLVIAAAQTGGGVLAGSWETVRAQLTPGAATNRKDINSWWLKVLEESAKPGGWMGEIELLPHIAGIRLKEAESDPTLLMLRERLPRPVPRGGWARFYAWPDGRSEEVRQTDSDFTAWEKRQATVPTSRQ